MQQKQLLPQRLLVRQKIGLQQIWCFSFETDQNGIDTIQACARHNANIVIGFQRITGILNAKCEMNRIMLIDGMDQAAN